MMLIRKKIYLNVCLSLRKKNLVRTKKAELIGKYEDIDILECLMENTLINSWFQETETETEDGINTITVGIVVECLIDTIEKKAYLLVHLDLRKSKLIDITEHVHKQFFDLPVFATKMKNGRLSIGKKIK